jgi:hypothetical protein
MTDEFMNELMFYLLLIPTGIMIWCLSVFGLTTVSDVI